MLERALRLPCAASPIPRSPREKACLSTYPLPWERAERSEWVRACATRPKIAAQRLLPQKECAAPLRQNAELFAHLGERLNRPIQLLDGVSCGHLRANACFPVGDDGEAEANHVHAMIH